MTIKLLLLKSGEDIISDISEMVIGDEENKRVIGYYLTKPCVVKVLKPITQIERDENNKPGVQISLYPWMPLTTDEKIPIPSDWMVTMVEPVLNLKEMYIKEVIEYGKEINESVSTNEQLDSNQSD
jgi:hypothetical protein